MRKLPHTAAEDLLELIMRRYERASTLLTSNRPVDDWGKLLGDTAAVTALLDRLLHHAHVLKCGPRSWRTKVQTDLRTEDGDEVELHWSRPPRPWWPVLKWPTVKRRSLPCWPPLCSAPAAGAKPTITLWVTSCLNGIFALNGA